MIALAFVFSILAPFATQKAQAVGPTVHIHKLQADSYNDNVPIANEDGAQIDDLSSLGTNVRPLAGVEFTAYPVDPATTPQQVQAGNYTKTGDSIVLGTTGEDGVVTWTDTPDAGTFVVEETKRPEEVSSSLAVPFLIQFPMADSQGNTLTEVHVYPKNLTAELPAVDKAVTELGNNNTGYDIGEEITWYLNSTIPTNIGAYDSFSFTDELSSQLTYQDIEGVYVGDQALTAGDHYTENQEGAEVVVTLTEAGRNYIQELLDAGTITPQSSAALADATANTNDAAFIEVRMNTIINETAVMGQDINNQFTLNYDNTPDATNPSQLVSDEPAVYTGGKRFVKTNGTGTNLEGAVFELFRADGTQMTWTEDLIAANPIQAEGASVGEAIQLTSSADGSFDIRGLAYEDGQTNNYYLVETIAPAGYVALQDNIDFTVSDTSYNTVPAELTTDAADADQQEIVNNTRPTIPETGGIGSILFIVLGLLLMGGAYYGFKKSNA